MLKVIKRVLRLSGDLSKRIYASFVFSFIDSIMAMFPVGAVFYTLTKIQNNKAFAGNDWLVLFGILIISLVVRMVFKYLVYSFQSTAGFEFVSRERITLGDKLRNVGMGFFHERNMGDITTTVTTDLRFLYKGIIINHNKKPSQPTLKRRFFKKKAAFFSWPGLGKEWC